MESINFPQPEVIGVPLSMRELTEALIKHYGLHEGQYDLMMEFQVSMGGIGPDPSQPLPGAAFAINRVGLSVATAASTSPVDASVCNPKEGRKSTAAPKKPATKALSTKGSK